MLDDASAIRKLLIHLSVLIHQVTPFLMTSEFRCMVGAWFNMSTCSGIGVVAMRNEGQHLRAERNRSALPASITTSPLSTSLGVHLETNALLHWRVKRCECDPSVVA